MTQVSAIDLHQLNVKTTADNKQISDTEYGAELYVNEEQNPTTRNIRFPNQMIEQINIALEQKGSGNFQPGSLKPAVGD